ncbi:T9SS type A sorting domain-containing protein [Bacteroidota bacterium]
MKTLLTSIILLCAVFSLPAQVINIPGDHSTIQAGINAASDGDTVLVAEGTYLENIRFRGKAITVASHYILDRNTSHISKTIIDGSQPEDPDSASAVTFCGGVDSTSVLCGLTITGGKGTYDQHELFGLYRSGGGILIPGESGGKIEHCIIRDNHLVNDYPQWGGGIAVFQGAVDSYDKSIIIQDNIIRNNSLTSSLERPSSSGGGIKVGIGNNLKHGIVIIQNNVIDSNLVRSTHVNGRAIGGGMNFGIILPTPPGEFIVRNNIFAHNKVEGGGFVRGGAMILIHINILSAYYEDLRPAPLVYNNLIYKNESSNMGGGISAQITLEDPSTNFKTVPQPAIINNTIVENKAQYGVGFHSSNSASLLMNNIFHNDLSSTGATELHRAGVISNYIYYNLISDGYITDPNNEGNISGDPYLNEDYHLTDSSPCVGAGVGSYLVHGIFKDTSYYALGYDYKYNVRPNPIDNLIDLGAIESPYTPVGTGVHELHTAKLKLYPTPVEDLLFIEVDQPITSIEIFNVVGVRLIHAVNVQERISMNQMEQGMYLIRVETDKGKIYSGKVLKK